jgi:hypothetical protein
MVKALILAATLLICAVRPGFPVLAALPGDADCSGAANSADALWILMDYAGLADAPCRGLGDVNDDGRLSSVDALLILQYDAGLVGELG